MTMNQILNCAVDDKLLIENVSKKVTLPKHHKKERRALTALEKEVIKSANFTIQVFLVVNKTVVFDSNTPVIKTGAESDAGNLTIPIPVHAVPFFKDFLKSVNTFYLFPGKSYETLSKTQYVKMWKRIITKMNDVVTTEKEKMLGAEPITGLTAHIFHHNYCTIMLYYSGISQKKAVELMGHSDIKMIIEVSAHLDEQKEAVQEKLDKAISSL